MGGIETTPEGARRDTLALSVKPPRAPSAEGGFHGDVPIFLHYAANLKCQQRENSSTQGKNNLANVKLTSTYLNGTMDTFEENNEQSVNKCLLQSKVASEN